MSFRFDKDFNRYEVREKLGEGTYGKVYLGVDKITGLRVALKISKFPMHEEGVPSSTIREICFLRSLKHPNIIVLQDVVMTPKKLGLIFEYMKCDLHQLIEKSANLSEITIKKILFQILKALHFCHSSRVIHRDLKPHNILLDFTNNVKIADFGLARSFQLPFKQYTHSVQTLWYRAPELILGCKLYDTAIDIWSVGCIFSEMVTGFALFGGSSEQDVLLLIFKLLGTPDWPEFKEMIAKLVVWEKVTLADVYPQLSGYGLDLLEKMLKIDPGLRISAFEALQHVIST